MRKQSLAIVDFWPDHEPASDPIALRLSQGRMHTDRVAGADLVYSSVFGRRHDAATKTTVSFSAETQRPPGRAADWVVDWRLEPGERHFRLPYWAWHSLAHGSAFHSPHEERRFCNFIYSNPGCPIRNAFFELLNRQRAVDALGAVMRNTTHHRLGARNVADWPQTKRHVLRDYRFTIAFENEEHVGYTTEKIVDAWLSGSVPIYWGNPAIALDFPPGSYLSLYEAGSLSKLVEQVLEADSCPDRYAQLTAANPFVTGHLRCELERYEQQLDDFCSRIDAAVGARPARHRVTRSRPALATRRIFGRLQRSPSRS